MTTNDDWSRFVAMMEKAGWKWNPRASWFNWHLEPEKVYCAVTGNTFVIRGGKVSNIGDWRQWLEAGQSPPPF